MSFPSRSQGRGPAQRRRRQFQIEAPQTLEVKALLAPLMTVNDLTATWNQTSTVSADDITTSTGTIDITTTPSAYSAAGFTSVAQLTSNAAFGGDIVRIKAGPGGDFGKGVYAISRGAGANADPAQRAPGLPAPINRPGVIYRVDPATGRSSVFFDLNTVLAQIDPGAPPGNGALPATGLINWYDIAFDPEGYFDGKPSMFVTSLSSTDPQKNAVYRIGPDGSYLGMFAKFGNSATSTVFPVQPSSILVPPPEQQKFLRGVLVGDANTADGASPVLFFSADAFRPGSNVTGGGAGVTATPMTAAPQVGLTSANAVYASPAYSVFTDFGQPASGQLPPNPGQSGVQGLQGEFLINNAAPNTIGGIQFLNNEYFTTDPDAATPDQATTAATPFRRFADTAFDQYGYFSYGSTVTAGTFGNPATIAPVPPLYAGSLFVADMSQGLSVDVDGVGVYVPVNGPGSASITYNTATDPVTVLNLSVTDANLGGRIVRVGPDGTVTPFATNFRVTNYKDANDFIQSTLSISFSADGTTLYASDNEGVWQFKTVTSLAGSTAGSLVGLNDLRSLGVPYEGQDQAVAVVDTGVDANNPLFRGRVAKGKNLLTNGGGNDDTAGVATGHGTPMAGVIAQFVPQSTLMPVNVFTAFQGQPAPTTGGTTPQLLYNGLQYVSQNPFVKDPVRPNTIDRVVGSVFGFGTANTFPTEGQAYKSYPQVVIALKNQMKRFRDLGIAPIAAAGQFGVPQGNTTATGTTGDLNGMAVPAVLNEMISVTGSFSFPFATGPDTDPTDPAVGVLPRPRGPILVTDPTTGLITGNLTTLTATDTIIFKDKLLSAANRGVTTDYVAPALDVPTFSATTLGVTTTNVGGTGLNLFQEGGTSLSAAMTTGAFGVVASALSYWNSLVASGGVTVDGYLTTPVGVNQLNFGPNGIPNLSAYQNPDSVNSILQWTAVPARDEPNTAEDTLPNPLFPNAGGPYPQYSRIDVGNAVAAIEGTIALNYLINNGLLDVIDSNKNGLITAQEIQTFVDNATAAGMPEAGAMARFLGGTARIPTTGFQTTAAGESPDQPDVLQRRFNFFDYAANGKLTGVVTIDQFKMLAHTLLPSPDAFAIVDRQRSSGNGYLLDPAKQRNYVALQRLRPDYVFVPPSAVKRFRGLSPQRFGVNRGVAPSAGQPQFTLFDRTPPKKNAGKGGGNKAGNNKGGSNKGGVSGGGNLAGGGGSNGGSNNGGRTSTGSGNVTRPTTGTTGQTTPGTGSGNWTSSGGTDYSSRALEQFLSQVGRNLNGTPAGTSSGTLAAAQPLASVTPAPAAATPTNPTPAPATAPAASTTPATPATTPASSGTTATAATAATPASSTGSKATEAAATASTTTTTTKAASTKATTAAATKATVSTARTTQQGVAQPGVTSTVALQRPLAAKPSLWQKLTGRTGSTGSDTPATDAGASTGTGSSGQATA